MDANGWTETTVKLITGFGHRYADGEKIVKLERVVPADGKELRVCARQEPVAEVSTRRLLTCAVQ